MIVCGVVFLPNDLMKLLSNRPPRWIKHFVWNHHRVSSRQYCFKKVRNGPRISGLFITSFGTIRPPTCTALQLPTVILQRCCAAKIDMAIYQVPNSTTQRRTENYFWNLSRGVQMSAGQWKWSLTVLMQHFKFRWTKFLPNTRIVYKSKKQT